MLVVEDDKKISDLVVRSLRAEHFAVRVANGGLTGWEMASTTEYDLIIPDRMLPGLTGDQLLKRLREQQKSPAVLILSARDSMDGKIKIFEAGADDYLIKPFALAELAVRVRALLRRPSAAGSSVVRIDDLELDRLGQQVKRAGKRIDLTSKEYALLEYLVAHAGRVLSRTMIVEHVWDDHFDGLTNIVDVYVRHLRSKVDDPFPTKLIRTVRGVGYVLRHPPGEPQGLQLEPAEIESEILPIMADRNLGVAAQSNRRLVKPSALAA